MTLPADESVATPVVIKGLCRLPDEPIDQIVELRLPGVMRRFDWSGPGRLGSAAFWVEQARRFPAPHTYQVGATLAEEVALCLLGGYGITERMAFAAFCRLRERNLVDAGHTPSAAQVEQALSEPLLVNGRLARYRFPQQRAQRVAQSLTALAAQDPPNSLAARELRDWLRRLPGVGPKTASWIVRNRKRADDVAVIDVHIRRAGVFAGVFDRQWRLPGDYSVFEEAFCAWASLGNVPTADLDACIWSQLAKLGNGARRLFGVDSLAAL
jgi:thermostable 8-oxoguanine DNA glycosylase